MVFRTSFNAYVTAFVRKAFRFWGFALEFMFKGLGYNTYV